jgi:Protein of unknown function (DUF4229)
VLRYTLLRVLLLVATAAVLWVLGLRGLLLALVAVLVSGVVSIVVLMRQRDAASSALDSRLQRINTRIDDSARAEDDEPQSTDRPEHRE